MSDLTQLDLCDAKAKLEARAISATELTKAHIEAMERVKPLNLYITETADQALKAAQRADEAYAKNEAAPLAGLPIANKDLFCTKGDLTTAGSKMLSNFISPYESTITQKLQDAGAIQLGKVNLDEFAMGSANANSHFGAALNPWRAKDAPDTALTPGGSSGGSAAIVAARAALGATGTDTGGSIRQPAAFCGIVGMKPTYGRCSRWGIVAFASSLDQAGPMTRKVQDAAKLLTHMAGHDPKDSTSAMRDVPDFEQSCGQSVKGMRIGMPKAFSNAGLSDEIHQSWQQSAKMLEDAGAVLVEIDFSHQQYALPAYYIIAPAEASSNLARYDGVRYGFRAQDAEGLDDLYSKTRAEGFGDEVKRRIMMGTYVLSAGYYDAYYKKAQRLRTLITQDYANAFQTCDFILSPTTPTTAFAQTSAQQDDSAQQDPITMYLNDIFTVPVNLAGLPAISLPTGLDQKGLPIGSQLIGRHFDEAGLFKAAYALEQSAGFRAAPLLS
ncbi:MAG: Asp-tRNA(Asn)/Glu-tRNA(Gln) amidotransferase subunit GatA [Alphaproteobacteria bacterium]